VRNDPTPGAALFRTIAELEGGAAFIVDAASGRLSYISPAIETLTGYPPAAFAAHIDGSATDALLAPVCRLISMPPDGAQPVRHELDLVCRSGHTLPLEITVARIDNAAGDCPRTGTVPSSTDAGSDVGPHIVGLVRDISVQRAQAAQQKKFASMLNHEFRTPLSTIDGAVQRLEATSAKADEPTRQRYRKIQDAVDRLIGMLDEYLSPDRMASVGRDKQVTTSEPLALLRAAAQLARAAGRTVHVDGGDLPLALRGSPEGLAMALKVLVDNALQYTPAGTPLFVEGRRDGAHARLTIRDEGPGIPADELPRVFDKGFRGRNATGRAGSGLGLYMAKSVVEVHGGTISAENNAQCGAVFTIRLPL
jgi:signal transduction histidine kinase